MKDVKWQSVYNFFKQWMTSQGYLLPILHPNDIQWSINVLEKEVELFIDILSFKRNTFVFNYEMIGLSHMDIDDVYDIHRPGLINLTGLEDVDASL